MSDGPHRSLPMRVHWRQVALRAKNTAFSPEQVGEGLTFALGKDLSELPLSVLRSQLGGSQVFLFHDELIHRLERSRMTYPGSSLWNLVIDAIAESVTDRPAGGLALDLVLPSAVDEYARSQFRSIEEHYAREATQGTVRDMRARLRSASSTCNYGAIAAESLGDGERSNGSPRPRKQAGIDDGPQL